MGGPKSSCGPCPLVEMAVAGPSSRSTGGPSLAQTRLGRRYMTQPSEGSLQSCMTLAAPCSLLWGGSAASLHYQQSTLEVVRLLQQHPARLLTYLWGALQYQSRAAEMYRALLVKESAKAAREEASEAPAAELAPAPAAAVPSVDPPPASNGITEELSSASVSTSAIEAADSFAEAGLPATNGTSAAGVCMHRHPADQGNAGRASGMQGNPAQRRRHRLQGLLASAQECTSMPPLGPLSPRCHSRAQQSCPQCPACLSCSLGPYLLATLPRGSCMLPVLMPEHEPPAEGVGAWRSPQEASSQEAASQEGQGRGSGRDQDGQQGG